MVELDYYLGWNKYFKVLVGLFIDDISNNVNVLICRRGDIFVLLLLCYLIGKDIGVFLISIYLFFYLYGFYYKIMMCIVLSYIL